MTTAMSLLSSTRLRFVLTTLLLYAPLGQTDTVKEQLASDYTGKVLTLRHFYVGEHLKFRADGTLEGDSPIGPWTVDGQLLVTEAKLQKSNLVIRGRRLILLYDSKLKTFQDSLTVVKNSDHKDRDVEKWLRALDVDIEIALSTEKPEQKEVSAAMQAVFLARGESMIDIAPACWRSYFELQDHRPPKPQDPNNPVYTMSANGSITPPRVTYDPEPEYSDAAREVKWQGTVLVSLVVEPTGTVRDVQIASPLGAGLDEKSVEAVSTWKFDPAQKDGKAVPLALKVEATFHLY
jgi:TonB family protein